MTEKMDVEEWDLTDAELVEVLKDHGVSRRLLMKVFGVGAGVAALGGTAEGRKGEGKGTRIDKVFGAPYSRDDNVPSGLVDHVVELHVHEGDGHHEGFPVGDEDGDGEDDVDEFHFNPVGLHVKPGDVVHFDNQEHEHTVSAFHEKWNPIFPTRVPDGVPGFTSPPFVGGESWLYRFTTKGVYDLFCFPHLTLGMAIRIVVFDSEEDDIEDDDTFVDWGEFEFPPAPGPGPFMNAQRVLTAEKLDPANIVDEGEVAWADLTL